ncbi:MAG: hypothetical protein CBD02_04560 [Candidatus Pelagibacter sp. TMED142]|mgnify:FL=1|nr:MAG: hypothetical protein CBD02_04560 [Candidatus Pelagibacter sp. TMED142]
MKYILMILNEKRAQYAESVLKDAETDAGEAYGFDGDGDLIGFLIQQGVYQNAQEVWAAEDAANAAEAELALGDDDQPLTDAEKGVDAP